MATSVLYLANSSMRGTDRVLVAGVCDGGWEMGNWEKCWGDVVTLHTYDGDVGRSVNLCYMSDGHSHLHLHTASTLTQLWPTSAEPEQMTNGTTDFPLAKCARGQDPCATQWE